MQYLSDSVPELDSCGHTHIGSDVVFTTRSAGCVCVSFIRSASQCQCFIFLGILNESANQSVFFLCSLLRAVFSDTHPAVLLKLAPAAATWRISQGVQLHVWAACWRIFYSKTISFFRHCSVFVRRKEGIAETGGWRRRPNPYRAPGRRLQHSTRL